MRRGMRHEATRKKVKIVSVALFAMLVAFRVSARAQQPIKIYRIGYLSNATEIRREQEEIFRQTLRELGYIEGQNITIEWRFSKGKLELLPQLAAELVRLNLDCIIAAGVAPTRAVKQATTTIPIVMANADDDPIRHGLVVSLARPGGNVTGFTNIGSELAGKRLELLKETVPRLSRVAIFWDARGPGGAGHLRESEIVAPALGIQLQAPEVRSPEDLDNAFRAAVKGRAEALVVVATGLMNPYRERVVDLTLKMRLPAMYSSSGFPLAGGLMSYDTEARDRLRGVATYVDKILRGMKPSDLPVQRPTKFELIINLKTAKQIGLTIPPNVLARADKVIR
jgi:putative ABC transport system substrate-binding protein